MTQIYRIFYKEKNVFWKKVTPYADRSCRGFRSQEIAAATKTLAHKKTQDYSWVLVVDYNY